MIRQFYRWLYALAWICSVPAVALAQGYAPQAPWQNAQYGNTSPYGTPAPTAAPTTAPSRYAQPNLPYGSIAPANNNSPYANLFPAGNPAAYGNPVAYGNPAPPPLAPQVPPPQVPPQIPAPQPPAPYVRPLPESVPPGPSTIAPAPAPEVPPPTADTFFWDQAVSEPPPKIWEGSIELGLNGNDGNSESFNIYIGAHAKRTLPNKIFTIDLDYTNNSADGITTTNRYFLEGRQEWLFGDSPWSFFTQGSLELDQFTAWEQRVAANLGFGYQFFENDVHALKGRFGAGASREIGGPDDSWVPEAVFGGDYVLHISDRQKFNLKADYYPSWEDYEDYRLVTRANWEILLDEAYNLSLKLGLVDRYDSTPEGAKPNDINYTAVLLWKF